MSSESRNIDNPHETRPFKANGHMDVITLGDFTLGRGVFEPGWKWSNDVKPIAGTDSCQVRHTGRLRVRPDDRASSTTARRCRSDPVTWSPSSPATTPGSTATRTACCYDTGVASYAKPS